VGIKIDSGGRWPLLAVAMVSLGLALPSLSIGLLSDDFSWLRVVRDSAGMGWGGFLAIPSPYGYFRPVPMAVFRFLGLALPGAVWPFRALVVSLHLANCLLIYLLGRRLDFPRRVALSASLLFAVLPCHAEALFWVSSLNEPLAAFLVLAGFLLLLHLDLRISAPLSTLLFTAALATRESSFCYIPILLMLGMRQPSLRKIALVPALLVPGAVFLSFRYLWTVQLPIGTLVSSPGALNLNPAEIGRRLFQYMISMALPVKSMFELAGFRHFESLRGLLAAPGSSPAAYWSLTAAGVLMLALTAFFAFRLLGRGLSGPLAFSVLALGVYLPFRNTSEHFLYLPSIGLCYGLGLLIARLGERRPSAGFLTAIALLLLYLPARADRICRWRQASARLDSSLSQLAAEAEGVPDGAPVLVEGLDNRYHGIPFIGEHSLNDAWSWRNPGRHLEFYFDRRGKDRYLIEYSPGSFTFSRTR